MAASMSNVEREDALWTSDKDKAPVVFEGPDAPWYATPGAAGFDLVAAVGINLPPHTITIVPTDLKMEIPTGHFLMVCSRSGLAKNGITVANSPGIVDSDYRGGIGVLLRNETGHSFHVKEGDRIAQGVLMPFVRAMFIPGKVNETKRGTGGFGSTGI